MNNYICSNCGCKQSTYGRKNSGCANVFWITCLIFTIFISLFVPVLWLVVGFEILFVILTSPKTENYCYNCGSKNSIIPINSPKGQKLNDEFYQKDQNEED